MRSISLVIIFLAWLAPADARGADGPVWSFDGYGTLGVIHSSEGRGDYAPSLLTHEGPGRSREWGWQVDSRIAAQLEFRPTSRFAAVVQVVAEDQYVDSYEPKLEWANLRYAVNPNLTVSLGRTALDTYLVSAHRKVGYVLPWVRPPVEMYRMVSITNSDGLDVSFNVNRGGVTYRGRLNYGSNDADEVGGAQKADQILASFNTLEWRAGTLHLAYQRAKVSSPFSDPFFALFDPFGPEGDRIQRRYDPDGKWMTFLGLGASYDPGDWFVMGEWGLGDTRSIGGRAEVWYLSGGYRFGRFTPYVTFADADRDHDLAVDGLTLAAYPAVVQPMAAFLNTTLQASRALVPVQRSVSFGARWDVVPGVAFKIQYDHVDVSEGPGTFDNLEPGFQPSGADLFSATVDFLF